MRAGNCASAVGVVSRGVVFGRRELVDALALGPGLAWWWRVRSGGGVALWVLPAQRLLVAGRSCGAGCGGVLSAVEAWGFSKGVCQAWRDWPRLLVQRLR